MTNQSFADALAQEAGVTSDGDRAVTFHGLRFTYEVNSTNTLLVAHQGSKVPVLLAPESDYTRHADELGVSEESKIGTAAFDQKYVIRDTTGGAKELLTSEVQEIVESLAPFVELEFCDDMIRLLKKTEGHSSAISDLGKLNELAQRV